MADIIDSYSETNRSTQTSLNSTANTGIGQTFVTPSSPAYTLDSCKFYLAKELTPTGNMEARLYAVTGTPGTDGKPTGSPLATSDAVVATTPDTHPTYTLITFAFSGANRVALSTSTHYVIVIKYSGGDASNDILVGIDNTSPTDDGNASSSVDLSTWSAEAWDVCFYVYGVSVSTSFATKQLLFGTGK